MVSDSEVRRVSPALLSFAGVAAHHDKPAAGRSLDAIFRPRSVAVIGASRKRQTIGREILANLVDYGFNGPVYPVNKTAEAIHSIRCFRSIKDIPGPVDLAIVTVPKDQVIGVAKACGLKGVRGLIV